MNTRLPVKMNITIASANEAIEYWLRQVVLKEEVKIKKVTFNRDDFTIEFDRESPIVPAIPSERMHVKPESIGRLEA